MSEQPKKKKLSREEFRERIREYFSKLREQEQTPKKRPKK